MIKVIHIITGLGNGGAEQQLVNNLQRLDKNIYKFYVVSLTDEGYKGRDILDLGIPILSLDCKKSSYTIIRFFYLIRAIYLLSKYMSEVNPKIIQTWLHHADLVGLIASKLAGYKNLIWSVHCSYLLPPHFTFKNRFLVKILSILSKIPKVVVFNSTAGIKSHIERGYFPRKMEKIPCGFDSIKFSPNIINREKIRKQINIAENDFVVGFVGRYHIVKDIRTFLLSVYELSKKHNNIKGVLAGENIDKSNEEILSMIKELELENIILLGKRDDVPDLMNSLDLFIMTSASEGFPNVLGEAMLTGLPCLVTNVGDCREVVGNNKYVFNVGDYKEISKIASEIVNFTKEQKKELSLYNIKRIVDTYEISLVSRKYHLIYQDLTNNI